jgi:hypothetical protein
MNNFLSDVELESLAGDPPVDNPEFNEVWDIRWNLWRRLKDSEGILDKNWIKTQIKMSILSYHSSSIKVVGITNAAFKSLAGPNLEFNVKRETKLYHRSHLFPRRACVDFLMKHNPLSLSKETFIKWIWSHDLTVLSLKEENNLLENKDYFYNNTITFKNPDASLFHEKGGSWSYSGKEKLFLKSLNCK